MTRRNALVGAKLSLCHAVLAVAVANTLSPTVAHAQAMETRSSFSIPAGDLASAIDAFSRQSGLQILYKPELLSGRRVDAINGSLANQEVLTRLLKGTDVQWERVNGGTIVLKPNASRRRDEPKAVPSNKSVPADAHTSVQDLEEMVVVGSRLGTSPVESAMPIKVITREDIDRSGAGNIAQALSYLSEISLNNTGDSEIGGAGLIGGNTNSSTVQMRGLPRGTTLVLINGRRAGDSAMFSSTGQFDLSTIPLALVERIEVLPAGASAVYGGDGLAGVVNVVLRRDAQGAELRIRKTVADGYDREMVSAMWGKSWDRGGMTVAANWNRNSALLAAERSITADQDFRRYGGMDQRADGGYPATIYSLAGCPAVGHCMFGPPLATRDPLPGLSSPVATVPVGSDGLNLSPADFVASQGQTNRLNYNRQVISAEQNRGISFTGRLDLSPSLEVFSEFSYTKRDVPAFQLAFQLPGMGEIGYTRVSADNPFNPFGVDVGVDFSYADTGLYSEFDQEYYRGMLGVRGRIGRFDWELTGTQSRDKATAKGAQSWDPDKIAAALNSSDPATALNPFVSDGSAPGSRELIASLLGQDLNHGTASRGDVLTGYIRGPLATIPTGQVQALIGLEKQRNEIRLDSNQLIMDTFHIGGVVKSDATFAELRVPILSPRAGSSRERIALTGAMRRESSDRAEGHTLTRTYGLEAWATEKLLMRATYSTAVRPLLSYSALESPRTERAAFYDPTLPGRPFQIVPVVRYGGVAPGLVPEHSETVTAGFLYRPSTDWSISLTHWDTKYRDRIGFISPQSLVDNENLFPGRVIRDPTTGRVTLLDQRQVNLSRYDSAGVDIAIEGYVPTRFGDFNAGLSATYTYKHESQLTEEAPSVDAVSVRRADGWAPRWKVVPRVGWQRGSDYNVTMAGRFVSRYRDSEPLSTGPNEGRYSELGRIWIVDFNADISLSRWLKGMAWIDDTRLNFGATNVLNKQPEFCAGCGWGAGYDASIYDIVGRTYYAELRLSF